MRARLEQALAAEACLGITAWDVLQEARSKPEGMAWQIAFGLPMVNASGSPSEAYVKALEDYVNLLRRLSKSQWSSVFAQVGRKHAHAERPLRRLADSGADPVWIAAECLRIVPSPNWNPMTSVNKRDRKWFIAALKKHRRIFAAVAQDYEDFCKRAAADLGFRLDIAVAQILRTHSHRFAMDLNAFTSRGVSTWAAAALAVSEHVRFTTGAYHDREVCDLLNAINPNRLATPGALQQYRVREDGRREHSMGSFFRHWVDEEIQNARQP